jgi:hypothetical protein
MDDIFEFEEYATEEKHSEECFCQLCRPFLANDQEEVVIAQHDLVAA